MPSPSDSLESRQSRRVDYHLHTMFSYDSKTSPEAVLERALQTGLGCVCVTDHDTIEGAIALTQIRCPEVEIVVGCEFTVEDGSHVIGLHLKDMISERRVPNLLEEIQRQGGLVLLPHPFRRSSGIFRNEMRRSDEFVREVLSFTDMVECFNGGDSYDHNRKSFAFAMARGLPTVAGSDAHDAARIGSVFVEYAEVDSEHGISPRDVYFPAQPPLFENPVKRRLMELYHRHRRSFPPALDAAYRESRKRLTGNSRREAATPPRMQYRFARTPRRRDDCM